jgi:hypothetical protein
MDWEIGKGVILKSDQSINNYSIQNLGLCVCEFCVVVFLSESFSLG